MLMSSAMKIYASDMRFYNADNTYGITIREPSSICKDDDGFMWVATKSGIYRLSDESKCYNVPYTTVNIVSVELVHRKGELYVFTNHGEIFRYNKRLDRFEHYLNLLSALNTEAIYLADIKIGGGIRIFCGSPPRQGSITASTASAPGFPAWKELWAT